MSTLSTLERRSAQSTAFRGHKMGRWHRGVGFSSRRCTVCDAAVWCETNPAPNSIDISGTAVSTMCEVPK